jgi:tetratricopeptide (TPR) repeat protein
MAASHHLIPWRAVGAVLGVCLSLSASPSRAAQSDAAPGADAEPAPVTSGLRAREPGPRPAESPVSPAAFEEAKRRYEEGVSFFQQGRMGNAREHFEAAYELTRAPDLLFNLAQVALALDHLEDAIVYFERYLAARSSGADREAVQGEIRRLKARMEREQAARRLRAELLRPPVRPAPRPMPRRPAAAMGLAIGGGAALVAGIALGGAAAGVASVVNGGERFDPVLDERGRALQTAGITFDVIGAAALTAGGIWLLTWHHRVQQERRLTLAPRGTALAGRF